MSACKLRTSAGEERTHEGSRDGWTRVRFGGIERLSTERCTELAAAGIDRSAGLEDLEPSPAAQPHSREGVPARAVALAGAARARSLG